jgi:hypothetical protein
MSRSLSALRELKRAFDEGLLSAVEFARHKISVLDGEEEVLTKWEVLGTAHPVSSELLQPLQTSINSLQQSVDTLLKRPVDSSTTIAPTTRVCSVNDSRVDVCPPTKRYKSNSTSSSALVAAVEPAAPRPVGQRSLFSMGVKVGQTRADGRTIWLTEAATRPTDLRHKCPYRGCDQAFRRPCELSNHVKGHKGTFMATPLASMQALQTEMNAAQLRAAREVHVKFIISDILSAVISEAREVGGWRQKSDGRKNNSGSSFRKIRSPAFKKKVILDYERSCEQHSEFRCQMSYLIAIKHGCSDNQVRTWFRNKAEIIAAARNRRQANCRYIRRKKKGRFFDQEKTVFDMFKKMRETGLAAGWPTLVQEFNEERGEEAEHSCCKIVHCEPRIDLSLH